jgi:hypothetical protein
LLLMHTIYLLVVCYDDHTHWSNIRHMENEHNSND